MCNHASTTTYDLVSPAVGKESADVPTLNKLFVTSTFSKALMEVTGSIDVDYMQFFTLKDAHGSLCLCGGNDCCAVITVH